MMDTGKGLVFKYTSPKDVKPNDWVDDMREWPEIEYGDVYNYLVLSRAYDGEEMKNYKSMDSFNYFKSGCVDKILHHVNPNGDILMKCNVRPSQRVNTEYHHPWIVCNRNGTVHTGGCTCMAGGSKTCSHVGALLWKIEYAVKRGLTGQSCTDVQAKWNRGTSRNLEPGPVADMNFSKPKRTKIDELDTDSESNNTITQSTFKSFPSHKEFQHFVDSSPLQPLFKINNTLINRSVSADTTKISFSAPLPHSEHDGSLSCENCEKFYNRYIKLTPDQIAYVTQKTVNQSQSELWHDSRKLRITGSTSHKVPVRENTNPDCYIREHIYPTFRGNMYTKHGQEGEVKAKQQLKAGGENIVDVGTVISMSEPWLSVSPDGIIKSDCELLLEIKCPFLKDTSLDTLMTSGKYDVVKEGDTYILKQNGPRGYFLQVQLTMHVTGLKLCKFVVWSTADAVTVIVPYDMEYCERSVTRLKKFYFAKLLPRIVDEFQSGRLKLCAEYVKASH